jgi:hypothetical protein
MATGSAKLAWKGVTRPERGEADRPDNDVIGEAAMAVDADDLQVRAAVRFSDAARIAFSAADERLDHDVGAFRRTGRVRPERDHVAGDFVPADAGIGNVRIAAKKDVEVAGAQPGRTHPDQGLAGTRGRPVLIGYVQRERRFENRGFHGRPHPKGTVPRRTAVPRNACPVNWYNKSTIEP